MIIKKHLLILFCSYIGWHLCSAIPSHENVCMAIQVDRVASNYWNTQFCLSVLVRYKKSGPPLFSNSPVVWDDQRLIKLTDTSSSFCSPSPCSKMLKDRHNHHRTDHPTQRGCLILLENCR